MQLSFPIGYMVSRRFPSTGGLHPHLLLLLLSTLALWLNPSFVTAAWGPGCGMDAACITTELFCYPDGSIPGGPGVGGVGVNLDGACYIYLEQSACDQCGTQAGPVFGDLCPVSACNPEDPDAFNCIDSVCMAQHEQAHTRQEASCRPCARESDAFQASASCFQHFISQYCGGDNEPDWCQEARNSAENDNNAVAFQLCLCEADQGSDAQHPSYPAGTCQQCAAQVSDAPYANKLQYYYCSPYEQKPGGRSFSAWQIAYFSEAELGLPSISGEAADPDGDGLSNLLEYAFALNPRHGQALSPVDYFFRDDHFVLRFWKNAAADDLIFRIGVKETLFSPYTYSTLGVDGGPMVISAPLPLPETAGSELYEAVDSVDKTQVPSRYFKFEITKVGPTTVTQGMSISPNRSYNTLAISFTGQGTVSSASTALLCTGSCTATLTTGSTAQLSATPAAGYQFVAWSGDCSGLDSSCAVTLNAPKQITAEFRLLPLPTPTPLPTIVPTITPTPTPSYNDTRAPKVIRVRKRCQEQTCQLIIDTQDSGKTASGVDGLELSASWYAKSCPAVKNLLSSGACAHPNMKPLQINAATNRKQFTYAFERPTSGIVAGTVRAFDYAGNYSKVKRFRFR